MVVINFKLSDTGRLEVAIDKPELLEIVLERCSAQANIDLGGYIAVRRGKVLTASTAIEDGDEIDVFPAISGG